MVKISTSLVNFGMATQKPTMSTLESIIYLCDDRVAPPAKSAGASQEGENFDLRALMEH